MTACLCVKSIPEVAADSGDINNILHHRRAWRESDTSSLFFRARRTCFLSQNTYAVVGE